MYVDTMSKWNDYLMDGQRADGDHCSWICYIDQGIRRWLVTRVESAGTAWEKSVNVCDSALYRRSLGHKGIPQSCESYGRHYLRSYQS